MPRALIKGVVDLPDGMKVLLYDGVAWIRLVGVHVKDHINRAGALKLQTPGGHDSDVLPPLRGQSVRLGSPGHDRMDCTLVDAMTDVPLELQPLQYASSSSSFEKSLLDLSDTPMSTSCGINSQIPHDIVVLRIVFFEMKLESPCSFLAAGQKAGLVRVDLQACFREEFTKRAVCQDGLPSHIIRVMARDIKGDVIHPCLKGNRRVSVLKGLERLVEDEFADGRSLWAPLQNAMGVVPRITSYAFSLEQAGPGVKVQSQLEMNRRVVELRRGLNDVVQVDGVVEAG